ncbi:MAG TPA: Rieske (2Fe-2S) protein [Pseudonocardiaceae bacterium]|nr:Rieske (2Fe-2S) protein [Pseudonocardiaceae bacterium]
MKQIDPVDRIAEATWLDGVAGAVRDATTKLLRPGWFKDALHGVWLGHPVHPVLAQFAVGCFTGAALLDVTGDRDGAASRLIRFGVLGSLPAAVAGLADYAEGHEEQQRVGVVHATANTMALAGYLVSLRLRATGRHGRGVLTGLMAYSLAAAGAALGGDLAFRWASGPNHAAEVPHAGPEDWTDLGAVGDFTDGKPVRVMAGLIPVLVLAGDGGFAVLHDRCSHMAGPLHQGEIVERDGDRCVVCPWHGSVFRLADGAIVRGPATAPQPVLDSRVENGRLQARVRPIPGVPAS